MGEKRFTFVDPRDGTSLDVRVPETVDPGFPCYSWPSAPVLASFIFHERQHFVNRTVLELGAGTGLPGVVASKVGARVTFSERKSKYLSHARATLHCNGVSEGFRCCKVKWGELSPTVTELPFPDVIIASDCFYDEQSFEDVIFTVCYFASKNPRLTFYTTYQVRRITISLKCLLKQWSLKAEMLSGDEYVRHVEGYEPPSHQIELLRITKRE